MKKKSVLSVISLLWVFIINAQTVIDYEGNTYNTVTIGTQIWMKENLRTVHYRNGDLIPNIINNSQWDSLPTGAYCYYNNDTSNANIYGYLYNWYAVGDSRNLCPAGWHVPSDSEWTSFINFTGGYGVAGGKLKEIGTGHWMSPNAGATNEFGFSALPGGIRIYYGDFYNMGASGNWWSSDDTSIYARIREMTFDEMGINRGYYYKYSGLSVRCICDSSASAIKEINENEEIFIFPNPATESIIINNPQFNDDATLMIYASNGILIYSERMTNAREIVDVRNWASGVYVVKIINANGIVIKKFIKN